MTPPIPQQKRQSPAQLQAMLVDATQRHAKGDIASAEVLYRSILDSDPKHFDALHMLAVVGYQTDQLNDCIALFNQARALRPNDIPLLVNFGAALKKAKRMEEALAVYEHALKISPQPNEALFYNTAQCFLALGRFAEAADFYRKCIALNPKAPLSHSGLGASLRGLGDMDGAIQSLECALAIDPKCVPALSSLALIYRDNEWLLSALLLLEYALSIDPQNADVRSEYAFMLLRQGRLAKGWEYYEGRFWFSQEKVQRRPVPPMYWGGEDLKDKKLLVWPEQGAGDQVLFCGMIPDVLARGCQLVLECDPRLVPVFKRSFPDAIVGSSETGRATAEQLKSVDYQSGMGSLGRFFRPDFASFPKRRGYLKPDPEKVAMFKARYGARPRIGLSWRSSAAATGTKKSSELLEWAPILRVPGVTFVDLQYGDTAEERAVVKERLGVEMIHDSDVNQIKDMDIFFAQVAAMDLVISISNTGAHVSGSLGQETWLLLSKGAAGLWYWFWGEEQNPWYPSIRPYRQVTSNDWSPVFNRVAVELQAWVNARSAA